MPIAGPKDGHASKGSRDLGRNKAAPRDLNRNVAVKSNGFRGASAIEERGGVRLGMCNSSRDRAARNAVRARFLQRKNDALKPPVNVGAKRKAEDAIEEENAREPPAAAAVPVAVDEDENGGAEDKDDAFAALEKSGFRCECCDVKCGSVTNYKSHVASKRHRRAADAERGRKTLEAMKRAKLERESAATAETAETA